MPGLYAAGDMASVPHNYMLGAFTNGAIAGEHAIDFAADVDFDDFDESAVSLEQERVLAPTKREDGLPPNQIEYKIRRLVNDYLQPPKVTAKYELCQDAAGRGARTTWNTQMMARDAHELMRSMEVASILDCADMAAFASLYRAKKAAGAFTTGGPTTQDSNDEDWKCHVLLSNQDGVMTCEKKEVAPYIIPIAEDEKDAYYKQRITAQA